MNQRTEKLKAENRKAIPRISPERALLLTQFHEMFAGQEASVPVRRALAFKYILENKIVHIGEDELIVGERGPSPKSVPTYPEICVHSESDLDMLDSREKVPYKVDGETRKAYRDTVIPFWTGKSVRERIFSEVSEEWKIAYEAGIFTEFQEQRSPGHTVLGGNLFRKGFNDLKTDIRLAIERLDFLNDPEAFDKREQLRAMEISAVAMIGYAGRHATKLRELATGETVSERKNELLEIARICDKVPLHAPDSFHEALQHYWFIHVGVITESNPWDSFNPGRLDQHLYPFYKRDMASGVLTVEKAKELLCAFWIKFDNHPAPPKTGVTSRESNTYVDFSLINLGGLRRDNSCAVNELTYLLLDIVEEMRQLQPSAMVQVSKKNPDRFLRRALEIVKTGFGQPSIFNTDTIVSELVRQGKSVEDAREGGASGCVEAGAFGRECYILTGYFNLPKVLELTLNNGTDPISGNKVGIETGDPRQFGKYDDLFGAFQNQLKCFIDVKIAGNNIIERINAKYMPVPFLSLLIGDCVAKGKDYNSGGARYNTSYIQGVGLGSVSDALTSLKYHVFDKGDVPMADILAALASDFAHHEALRRKLSHDTPKYGNDDDYADTVMKAVFEVFFGSVDGRPNTKGGVHRINLLPTTCHVYFGSLTGALPDGRHSGTPLSEGISPVQGADRNGPTAVVKSAAKIDHVRTGGTLLNQKFLPQVLEDGGTVKLANLVRSYFKMDGHHIQFNVVDGDTLRKARQSPGEYRDLIVRVAGYSDYFVDLTHELQDEIIHRTEHDGF